MALITFGPIVSDARKKIGGVVFSKSRTGAYVRKKVSPIQPRTTSQRAVRANFTANSKGWSGTLDNPERQSFSALAASLTKKDRLGQSFTLTGAQLYQSTSRNLHTIGLPPLLTAPENQAVSDLGGILLVEVPSETSPLSGLGITVQPVNAPATDEYLVITGAAPTPPGRAFVGKGKYRVLMTGEPSSGSPAWADAVDVTAAYEAKFGTLKAGQVIHLQVNNINSVNGAQGKPYPGVITLV
jgi:hypothetical protein